MLAAEGPDLRFESISAGQDRALDVSGAATGVAAMGRFQSHVAAAGSPLDLTTLHWEADGPGLRFAARLAVKEASK